jgi:hypothetical protein
MELEHHIIRLMVKSIRGDFVILKIYPKPWEMLEDKLTL